MDGDSIEAFADGDFDVLPERDRVVAEFAMSCIEDPHRIRAADIDTLRAVGFVNADIIQLLVLIGYCNTANLVVNAPNAHPADLDRSFRY